MTAMPAGVAIRAMAAAEGDAVAALWLASWRTVGLPLDPEPTVETLRARLADEIAGGWVMRIAATGDLPIGLLAVRPAVATVEQVFVAPGAVGCGIGRALIAEAARLMPAGFRLTTFTANRGAIAFYHALGLSPEPQPPHPHFGHAQTAFRWTPPIAPHSERP